MTLGQTNTTKNITPILHHKHTFLKQGHANSHNSLGIARKESRFVAMPHISHIQLNYYLIFINVYFNDFHWL